MERSRRPSSPLLHLAGKAPELSQDSYGGQSAASHDIFSDRAWHSKQAVPLSSIDRERNETHCHPLPPFAVLGVAPLRSANCFALERRLEILRTRGRQLEALLHETRTAGMERKRKLQADIELNNKQTRALMDLWAVDG